MSNRRHLPLLYHDQTSYFADSQLDLEMYSLIVNEKVVQSVYSMYHFL